MEKKEYTSPIGLTSQFRFCGAAFRIDLNKGCFYGCNYCFINNRHKNNSKMGQRNNEITFASIKKIERMFINSIDKGQVNTFDKELLNRKTPLHLGGNSDPFINKKLALEFIDITKKYAYPILISTKSCLDEQYLSNFDNKIHAFQVSLISKNQNVIDLFEKNTPSAKDRIDFIKRLHRLGFWVSVRIQPLVNLNEGLELIDELINYVDFITIEHLKLQPENIEKSEILKKLTPEFKYKKVGNSMNVLSEIKYKNIQKIKQHVNGRVKLGFGDNDMHIYSDTNNCCGIDTINENFNNWLNYNSLAIKKGVKNLFIPNNNPSVFPYIKKTGENYKCWVDSYVIKNKYYTQDNKLF